MKSKLYHGFVQLELMNSLKQYLIIYQYRTISLKSQTQTQMHEYTSNYITIFLFSFSGSPRALLRIRINQNERPLSLWLLWSYFKINTARQTTSLLLNRFISVMRIRFTRILCVNIRSMFGSKMMEQSKNNHLRNRFFERMVKCFWGSTGIRQLNKKNTNKHIRPQTVHNLLWCFRTW